MLIPRLKKRRHSSKLGGDIGTWSKQSTESLHSTLTTNTVNKRQPFPKAYLPFVESLRYLDKSFNYSQLFCSDEDSRKVAENLV